MYEDRNYLKVVVSVYPDDYLDIISVQIEYTVAAQLETARIHFILATSMDIIVLIFFCYLSRFDVC